MAPSSVPSSDLDRFVAAFRASSACLRSSAKEAHGAVASGSLRAPRTMAQKGPFADQDIQTRPIAEHSCVNRTRWSRMRTRSDTSGSRAQLLALAQLRALHTGEKRVASRVPSRIRRCERLS